MPLSHPENPQLGAGVGETEGVLDVVLLLEDEEDEEDKTEVGQIPPRLEKVYGLFSSATSFPSTRYVYRIHTQAVSLWANEAQANMVPHLALQPE